MLTTDSNDDNSKSKKVAEKAAPPTKKKMKLEPTARSRLMKICDSSSDEEDVKPQIEEIEEVKKEKENTTPSPEKKQNAETASSSNGVKKRGKVKKMVTKTYEDDDGFISKSFLNILFCFLNRFFVQNFSFFPFL